MRLFQWPNHIPKEIPMDLLQSHAQLFRDYEQGHEIDRKPRQCTFNQWLKNWHFSPKYRWKIAYRRWPIQNWPLIIGLAIFHQKIDKTSVKLPIYRHFAYFLGSFPIFSISQQLTDTTLPHAPHASYPLSTKFQICFVGYSREIRTQAKRLGFKPSCHWTRFPFVYIWW